MDEPVKKKRGRKPKSHTQSTDQNVAPAEPKVKKKRGRKPKQVFIMDQTDLKIDTDEQVILHLPINSKDKNELNDKRLRSCTIPMRFVCVCAPQLPLNAFLKPVSTTLSEKNAILFDNTKFIKSIFWLDV